MAAQVVPLFRRFQRPQDWTQRELAEFYRVESALIQAGLQLETDRGVTDEGDPWFVFCRADTGEVFIHFARIDGQYIAIGAALEQLVEGKDFPTLVQEMLTAQAWVMAKARNTPNVSLHPAALLIALVGAAFFHSSDAKAAETVDHARPELRRHVLPILFQNMSDKLSPAFDTTETATILSGVLLGLNGLPSFAPPIANTITGAPAEVPSHPIILPPTPTPTPTPLASHTADVLGAPVTPQASLDPSQQQSLINPHFGLENSLAPAPGVLADQPAAAPGAAGGLLAAVGAHLDFTAPVAVNAAGLLQASSTDAAEIVQSSNILSYLVAQPALAPVTPSAALTSLINQGEHVPSVTSPTPPENGTHDGSVPAVVSPAPSEPAPDSVETNLPVAAVVAAFAAEVSVLDIAFSGHEIILYDGAILKSLPHGTQLDSVTFNFTDGSSVSLVGTAAEMLNLHLPG
jgi:hypothetical protein